MAEFEHGMNCAAWHNDQGHEVNGEDCTCRLRTRIALSTEQTMHAAWRKRAEEAESQLAAMTAERDEALNMNVGLFKTYGSQISTITAERDVLKRALDMLADQTANPFELDSEEICRNAIARARAELEKEASDPKEIPAPQPPTAEAPSHPGSEDFADLLIRHKANFDIAIARLNAALQDAKDLRQRLWVATRTTAILAQDASTQITSWVELQNAAHAKAQAEWDKAHAGEADRAFSEGSQP